MINPSDSIGFTPSSGGSWEPSGGGGSWNGDSSGLALADPSTFHGEPWPMDDTYDPSEWGGGASEIPAGWPVDPKDPGGGSGGVIGGGEEMGTLEYTVPSSGEGACCGSCANEGGRDGHCGGVRDGDCGNERKSPHLEFQALCDGLDGIGSRAVPDLGAEGVVQISGLVDNWWYGMYRGLSTCLAYGELIDRVAAESSDYADFVSKIDASVEGAGALVGEAATPGDPGFNGISAANGHHNYRHYAGALFWGNVAAAGQAVLDTREVFVEGPDEVAENIAEVYSDLVGGAAITMLSLCVAENTAWYKLMAYDDDAWAKCRQLPGNIWRLFFCTWWS